MNIFLIKPKHKVSMNLECKKQHNISREKNITKPKSLLINLNKKNKKRIFGKDIKNIRLLSKEDNYNKNTKYFNNKKRKRDKSNDDTEISSKINELLENKENIPNMNINISIIKNSELKFDISNNIKNDIQIAKEYITEIHQYLKSIESQNIITSDYITIKQPELNIKMRTILINWLIEVHYKFHLLDETLFICIKILDLYLSKKTIERKHLQLLGITSLFIAAKYEEIYAPKANNLIFMTDNAYSKEDMITMENDILNVINFNLSLPSSLRFIEIHGNFLNLDKRNFFRVLYINELSLVNYNLIKFYPSLIACTCLYINLKSNEMINMGYDEEKLYKISGYNYKDIIPCLYELNNTLNIINEPNNKFISIKKKYSLDKYMNVSNDNFIISN